MPRINPRLLIAALITLLFIASTALAEEQDKEVKIAVLVFEVNADPVTMSKLATVDQLLAQRLAERGFQVVPRATIYNLIKSQNIQYVDLEAAQKLAVRAGAQYAIYGSITQVGETLSLDARLVDAFGVNPPRPITVTQEGSLSVGPMVEELATKLSGTLLISDIITEIEVEGTETLDKDVVLMRLKIQKGDPFDESLLNDEVKRIFELGYFDDVKILADDVIDGKRITVQVVEKPRIAAISVIGADEIDEDDILDTMDTKAGTVLNMKILAEDLNKIRAMYRQDGFFNAQVSHEIQEGEGHQARLNIVVDEGKELFITDIAFEGVEQVDESDLEGVLYLSERSIISWFTGSGVLRDDVLERDTAALLAYYTDNGFVDAKVGQPRVEYLDEGIRVVFPVEEGDPYKVGKVYFKGELLAPTEELYELIEADDLGKHEELFKGSVVREDARNLTTFYNDYGYAYANCDIGSEKNEEEKTVDIFYVLSKQQKVYIRRVIIEGNVSTRDNVIRRELELTDGELFSGTKLRSSIARLNKLGIFETAEIEPIPTDDPREMDLKVAVKEQSSGMVSGGFGYSTGPGFFVAGKITEQNMFGMGYQLSLMASLSFTDTRYQISFYNPSLWDSLWGFGSDIYYTTLDADVYNKDTFGIRPKISYPVGRYTRMYLSYRLDRYTITQVEDDAADAIKDIEGENWSSVSRLAFVRDTTDKPINPSEGMINSLAFTYGGGLLMGDDHFGKVTFDTGWYIPIGRNLGHVLHLRSRLGKVFQNTDQEVPVFERFYLGGINSLRGYEPYHVSPRDPESGDRIGGDNVWYANIEYLVPLSEEIGLTGLVFFDMGDTWGNGDHEEFKLRRSVGLGIRWFSPMGPMRFEWGYPIDQGGDGTILEKGRLEFFIGQPF